MNTPRQGVEDFVNGQLSDAQAQMQRTLTSIFMAENTLRQGVLDGVIDPSSMSKADALFNLRKQLAALMQQTIGVTTCIPQHNQILYNK
jgi:hypothetical protein